MANDNRDEKGQYATFWKGLASTAALFLMWLLFASGLLGFGR